jgi:hypothetical protein
VGPATVQISVVDACLILQIANEDVGPLPDTMPFLQEFLADSTILKAGVGLDQDMLELYRWEQTSMIFENAHSRLDIGGIGGSKNNGNSASLKTVAQLVLGVTLQKSKKISMSNWAKAPLSDDQISYAARDAWASAAVLSELAARDPSGETYSTASLLKLVLAKETPMDELDARAVARKEVKTKLLDIIKKGDEKVNRNDLSEEQLAEVEQLEKEMKELAPPRPFVFNVEPLGLALR